MCPQLPPELSPCAARSTDLAVPVLQSPELLSLAGRAGSFALHGPSSLWLLSLEQLGVRSREGSYKWLVAGLCWGHLSWDDGFLSAPARRAPAGETLPNPFAACWAIIYQAGRQSGPGREWLLPFVPLAAADRSLLGSKVRPLQPLGTDLFSLSGLPEQGRGHGHRQSILLQGGTGGRAGAQNWGVLRGGTVLSSRNPSQGHSWWMAENKALAGRVTKI